MCAGMHSNSIRLAVLTPVYNDWDCVLQLINALGELQSSAHAIELLIINDGSTHTCPQQIDNVPSWLESLKIINLVSNVGHQRAIAIGLSHLVQSSAPDAIITLDSDGEDSPQDAVKLVRFWLQNQHAIAVATRGKRSEGQAFSLLYRVYKLIFKLFTGARIDFGNFTVLSFANAKRLAAMPELWNHFPSTILKSRLPVMRLQINRGTRYAGDSKMSLVSLINHGLSSVSVFFDIVLARLLLLTIALAVLLVALASLVLVIKLFTDLAIPGWASLIVGLTALGILQVLATQIVVIFLALSSRSSFQMPTLALAPSYIEGIRIYQRS
ncbi:MAG: glycosyltransferase [Cyanobacteria bacterium K_DeepCast_35m_m2_023]|nr:glycosyltransferase [Cyanobacteria bacterium K_DeepCast_35m_m2_023]